MIHTVVESSIHKVWLELLLRLKWSGRTVSPRNQECAEIEGLSLRVTDLRQNILVHPKRNLNYRFMVAEWLWIALGREDVAAVARYNSKIAQFSDDGFTFAGAYGPRLLKQWDWVYEKLKVDSGTRQAVVSIWTPAPKSSKDIPCTLSMQFLLRGGQLNCIVTMRSSDAWLGVAYDLFNFSMLANALAGRLGVLPGWLQLNLGSAHLYERDRKAALAVLNDWTSGETVLSPRLPEPPPDIFDKVVQWEQPWQTYHNCLTAHTSAEALEALRELQPLP